MRLRARAHGVDVVCRMVGLGAGVAVVPESAALRWQDRGKLSVVRLEDTWADRRLLLVVRQLDALPSQARRLAAYLLAQAPVRAGMPA